jgi:hypothetical protein
MPVERGSLGPVPETSATERTPKKEVIVKRLQKKSTAERVLDRGESIIDVEVTQSVSLHAFPESFKTGQDQAFTLEVELWPEYGTVHLSKRPYLAADLEHESMKMAIGELKVFADGVMELVSMARKRGWLT